MNYTLSNIAEIALEVNYSVEKTLEKFINYCEKFDVVIEESNHNETVFDLFEEQTESGFELCFLMFGYFSHFGGELLKRSVLKVEGYCDCGGKILDKASYANDCIQDEWEECEICETKF